jgi:hypothetical protein
MPTNHNSSDNSLSYTKIHKGVDFDAMIRNAMNSSSSEKIADYSDAGEKDIFVQDLERGSASSSNGSDADAMSLGSDDISVDGESSASEDKKGHHEASNLPLVNDDESVMDMKNPAPVCQSVSSYVDQLNHRGLVRRSRLIKASVFAIFVALIVGVALAVVSVTGKKGNGQEVLVQPPASEDQSSSLEDVGLQNVVDKPFRSGDITIDATLSLSGLVIPSGELQAVKDILERTIGATVSNFLTQDQAVMDVTVTSIDFGERILNRVLENDAIVAFKITLKATCLDCDDKTLQSMGEDMCRNVISRLNQAIDTGVLTYDLLQQALSVNAVDGVFEGKCSQWNNGLSQSTQPPTPQEIAAFNIPSPSTSSISSSTVATTMASNTPSPTLSPTLALVTDAFTKPPVGFAPTDPPVFTAPPVEFATANPTKRPTRRPTLRPTPR